MKQKFFTKNCPECPEGYNKGEQVEWKIGYELTGIPSKRNNKPGAEGGDVEGWQVKSPKASMAKEDNCKGYIFGFANENFYYEMTIEEFEDFLKNFSYIDRDSKTGKSKVRIKNDSNKMRKWFQEKI